MITKPLQLMVALSIAQQDVFDSKPTFIIIDKFKDAQSVADKLSVEFSGLQEPIYFSSRKSALRFIKVQKFDNLFIDSDVGAKNFLALALLKLRKQGGSIFVYEEGVGTYRADLYSGIRKSLFDFIGVGAFFGACRFVDGVYVYRVVEYSKQVPKSSFKAREIKVCLSRLLSTYRIEFKRLFDFDGITPTSTKASCCSLYLSDWKVDDGFLTQFQRLEGDLFVKLHPHIRHNFAIDGVQSIGARVPAELVIMDLIDKYQSVRIYDNNSSVRRYINDKKIKYISIDTVLNVQYASVG